MNLTLKQIVAFVLSVDLFLVNGVWVHAVESNLWKDRHEKLLARLPTEVNPIPGALKDLFSGQENGRALPTSLQNIALKKSKSPKYSAEIDALLGCVSLHNGSIQEVYAPVHASGAPVVIIQDVHMNAEAQMNMAGLLNDLLAEQKISRVGVEGAFGTFDFSRFRKFPDSKIIRQVSETFVQNNKLAAPSFVGITSEHALPAFIGVDDPAHYAANVKAYLESAGDRHQQAQQLSSMQREVGELKKKFYSSAMLEMDGWMSAYRKGHMDLGPYVKKLTAGEEELDIALELFVQAYDMEKSIDFNKVDQERRRVIERLAAKLNEQETKELVARSVQYRMGKISFHENYSALRALCQAKGIDLKATPMFNRYIQYVLLADGIKPDVLFNRLSQLEDKKWARLISNEDQKQVRQMDERLVLTEKLMDFSLTPQEWERYRRHSGLDPESSLTAKDWIPAFAGMTDSYERFYREADIRSQMMVQNLLGTRHEALGTSLLVTGGFHTSEIAEILKEKSIPYIVLTPKITKIDTESGSAYLSIFEQEKSSVNQLFKGEKLFLSAIMVAGIGTGHPAAEPYAGQLADEIGEHFKPASFLDRLAKWVLQDRPDRYRFYTRWFTPGWETPVFGALFFGIRAALSDQLASIDSAFVVISVLVAVTAAVLTLIHALLNWDWSKRAFSDWMVGGVVLVLPFAILPLPLAVAVSFGLHVLWNYAPFLHPMRLFELAVSTLSGDLKDIIGYPSSLIFTDDPDWIDMELYDETKRTGQQYMRVSVKDAAALGRATTTVWEEDGVLQSKDGRMLDIIKNGGVIMIDYSDADSKVAEGLNSLFDHRPYFRGIQAHQDLKIVGVISRSRFLNHSISFYSRFRAILTIKRDPSTLLDLVRAPPPDVDAVEVELFESSLFRRHLVEDFSFGESGDVKNVERKIIEAVKAGKPLIIKGGLWTSPDFANFIKQVIIKNEIEINGKPFEIPSTFKIYRLDGNYRTREITNKRILSGGESDLDERTWIINKQTQDLLLSRNEIINGNFVEKPGLLAEPQLKIRITDDLDDWVWHRILHSNPNAKIEIEVLPGKYVPKIYRKHRSEGLVKSSVLKKTLTWDEAKSKRAVIVQAEDVDYALSKIEAEFGEVSRQDVTHETKVDRFLASMEIRDEKGRRKFTSRTQGLIKALKDGKVVVIQGLESNPQLLRQFETALSDQPYLIVNNEVIDLSTLPGKLVLLCRPSLESDSIGTERVRPHPTNAELRSILTKEFQTSPADLNNIFKMKELFKSAGATELDFGLDRLRILLRSHKKFGRWTKAFEHMLINEYADKPENAAFMRVMVRLEFNEEGPNGDLDEIRRHFNPNVNQDNYIWRMADCLPTEMLKKLTIPGDFQHFGMGLVKSKINSMPIKKEKRKRDFKKEWEDRVDECADALNTHNSVFLKGSPGTGKSHITKEIAKALGYGEDEIVGPITVGADTREVDLMGGMIFDGKNTEFVPGRLSKWAEKPRGLLIIDEANLTNPHLWNFIQSLIDDKHQVIFTGNQETVEGRKVQTFIRHYSVTIPFAEFDDDFIKNQIKEYLASSQQPRKEDLEKVIFTIFNDFRRMNEKIGFSLRDIQEFTDRVQVLCSQDWTNEEVLLTAWTQFQGLFSPTERAALALIFNQRFGVDPVKAEAARQAKEMEKWEDFYKKLGLALVPTLGKTAFSIMEFLKIRAARKQERIKQQGKRGMIFEGPSGRGKDHVVVATLQALGFVNKKDVDTLIDILRGVDPENLNKWGVHHLAQSISNVAKDLAERIEKHVKEDAGNEDAGRELIRELNNLDYYRSITVSPDKYQALETEVKLAQNEGCPIIVSELNLLPTELLEGKLNDVLTGAAANGFSFFSTNNSTKFNGREKLSSALQNRVIYEKEEDYDEEELRTIARFEASRESASRGVPEEEIEIAVQAHLWIRNQIKDSQYRPTTRELVRVMQFSRSTIEEQIQRVYGPIYLNQILEGRPLPSSAELLAKVRTNSSKPSLNNLEILTKVGAAILPKGDTPFSVGTDTSQKRQENHTESGDDKENESEGGYMDSIDNVLTLRSGLFRPENERRLFHVFWHELSHGLFTRVPLPNDLYQDLEDLRHQEAFDAHFPNANLNHPQDEDHDYRMAKIIKQMDSNDLKAWMGDSERPLTSRMMFQYTLLAFAQKRITREDVQEMADDFEDVLQGDPFRMALPHLEAAMEIKNCIPKTLDEDEILEKQYHAYALMKVIAQDFALIPKDETPVVEEASEKEQEEKVAQAAEQLEAMNLSPIKAEKPQSTPIQTLSAEEKAKRKAAIKKDFAPARKAQTQDIRDDVTAKLGDIEKDLNDPEGITMDRLLEMEEQLTSQPLVHSLRHKLVKLNDAALTKRANQLLKRVQKIKQHARDESIPLREGPGLLGALEKLGEWLGVGGYIPGMPRQGRRRGPVQRRYARAAHDERRTTHRSRPFTKPKPAEFPIVRKENHKVPVHSTLEAVTANKQYDLNMVLRGFVEQQTEIRTDYGPPGVLESITEFVRDPINGFLRTGSGSKPVKMQVLIKDFTSEGLVLSALIHYLNDNGHPVSVIAGAEPSEEQLKELSKSGPVEVISQKELLKLVEGIYVRGTAESLLNGEKAVKKPADTFDPNAPMSPEDQDVIAKDISGADSGGWQRDKGERIFSLDLSKSVSNRRDLAEFSQLTEVTELTISYTKITSLAGAESFKKLRKITMKNCRIDDFSPVQLLPNLELIIIDWKSVPGETDKEKMDYLWFFAKMQENKNNFQFQIEGISELAPDMIPEKMWSEISARNSGRDTIFSQLGKVRQLHFRQVKGIKFSDVHDPELFLNTYGLEYAMTLSNTRNFTKGNMMALYNLADLTLSQEEGVPLPEGLGALANNVRLQKLSIHNITVDDLSPLNGLPDFQELQLTNCGLTKDQVQTFIDGHRNAAKLRVELDGKWLRATPTEKKPSSKGGLSLKQQLAHAAALAKKYRSRGFSQIVNVEGVARFIWLFIPINNDGPFLTDISELLPLTELEELRLDLTQVKDLNGIEALQKLRSLNIGRLDLDDWTPLLQLKNLEKLVVHWDAVPGQSARAKMSFLWDCVHIHHNQNGDKNLRIEIEGMPLLVPNDIPGGLDMNMKLRGRLTYFEQQSLAIALQDGHKEQIHYLSTDGLDFSLEAADKDTIISELIDSLPGLYNLADLTFSKDNGFVSVPIQVVEALEKCERLKSLSFVESVVFSLTPLRKIASLEILFLKDTGLTIEQVEDFIKNHPNAKNLKVCFNGQWLKATPTEDAPVTEKSSPADVLSRVEQIGLAQKLSEIYNGHSVGGGIGMIDGEEYFSLVIPDSDFSDVRGLQDLTELEYLNLAGTKVTDLAGIGTLKKLKHIMLSQLQIHMLDPLLENDSLERIIIDWRFAQSSPPKRIEYLWKFLKRHQKFESLKIEIHGLGGLGWLPSDLQEKVDQSSFYDQIAISNSLNQNLSDKYPAPWVLSKEGFQLKIKTNLLEKLTYPNMRNLVNVESLEIFQEENGTEDLPEGLNPLQACRQLERLEISNVGVYDLSPLKNLHQLRFIELNNTGIDKEEFQKFIDNHFNRDYLKGSLNGEILVATPESKPGQKASIKEQMERAWEWMLSKGADPQKKADILKESIDSRFSMNLSTLDVMDLNDLPENIPGLYSLWLTDKPDVWHLDPLEKHPGITAINFGGTKVRDISPLLKLPKLVTVYLSNNYVDFEQVYEVLLKHENGENLMIYYGGHLIMRRDIPADFKPRDDEEGTPLREMNMAEQLRRISQAVKEFGGVALPPSSMQHFVELGSEPGGSLDLSGLQDIRLSRLAELSVIVYITVGRGAAPFTKGWDGLRLPNLKTIYNNSDVNKVDLEPLFGNKSLIGYYCNTSLYDDDYLKDIVARFPNDDFAIVDKDTGRRIEKTKSPASDLERQMDEARDFILLRGVNDSGHLKYNGSGIELDLRGLGIRGLDDLPELPDLTALSLNGEEEVWHLHGIEKQKKLEMLDIRGTGIRDISPLLKLKNLKVVWLTLDYINIPQLYEVLLEPGNEHLNFIVGDEQFTRTNLLNRYKGNTRGEKNGTPIDEMDQGEQLRRIEIVLQEFQGNGYLAPAQFINAEDKRSNTTLKGDGVSLDLSGLMDVRWGRLAELSEIHFLTIDESVETLSGLNLPAVRTIVNNNKTYRVPLEPLLQNKTLTVYRCHFSLYPREELESIVSGHPHQDFVIIDIDSQEEISKSSIEEKNQAEPSAPERELTRDEQEIKLHEYRRDFVQDSMFTNWESGFGLTLRGPEARDLNDMPKGFTRLKTLNFVDTNHVFDISPIERFPNLEELDISGTDARDISVLYDLPNLRKVTVNSKITMKQIKEILNTHVNPHLDIVQDGKTYRGIPSERYELQAGDSRPGLPASLTLEEEVARLQLIFMEFADLSEPLSPEQTEERDRRIQVNRVWEASDRGPTINVDFSSLQNVDPRRLQWFYFIKRLDLNKTNISDVSKLIPFHLRTLNLDDTQTADLMPLLLRDSLKVITVRRTRLTRQQIEDFVERYHNPDIKVYADDGIYSKKDGKASFEPSAPAAGKEAAKKTPEVSNDELQFFKRLLDSLVDKETALAYAREEFRADGRLEEFEGLLKRAEEQELPAPSFKPASGPYRAPPQISPSTQELLSKLMKEKNQPPTSSAPEATLTASENEMKAIADNLVEVALAASGMKAKDLRKGDVVANLMSINPDSEVHIGALAGADRNMSFGAMVSNPRFKEDEFIEVLNFSLHEKISRGEIAKENLMPLLQELAMMGLPVHNLEDIIETALETVTQVVVVVNGPEDQAKVNAIRKIVNFRRPIITIMASTVTDRHGRLVLSRLDERMSLYHGRRLEDALLLVPEGMLLEADLPEDIMKSLLIATLNELLKGRLMPGGALLHIDKIARAIKTSA